MFGRYGNKAVLLCVIAALLMGMIMGCGSGAPLAPQTLQPSTQPPTSTPPAPLLPSPETQPGPSPQDEMEEARRLYPPGLTRALLTGAIPAPGGIDTCLAEKLGLARLQEMRAGNSEPTGTENDIAAICLMRLNISPESLQYISVCLHALQPPYATLSSTHIVSLQLLTDGAVPGPVISGHGSHNNPVLYLYGPGFPLSYNIRPATNRSRPDVQVIVRGPPIVGTRLQCQNTSFGPAVQVVEIHLGARTRTARP